MVPILAYRIQEREFGGLLISPPLVTTARCDKNSIESGVFRLASVKSRWPENGIEPNQYRLSQTALQVEYCM